MSTWTTKDGITIKIKDMETSHIKNCINYLKENPVAYGGCGFSVDDFYYEPDYEETNEHIKRFEDELKFRIGIKVKRLGGEK